MLQIEGSTKRFWFWLRRLLTVVLFITFVAQTIQSCNKFLHRDTGTTLRLDAPEPMAFPSVTLCPIPRLLRTHDQTTSEVEQGEMDFEWELSNLNSVEFLVGYLLGTDLHHKR